MIVSNFLSPQLNNCHLTKKLLSSVLPASQLSKHWMVLIFNPSLYLYFERDWQKRKIHSWQLAVKLLVIFCRHYLYSTIVFFLTTRWVEMSIICLMKIGGVWGNKRPVGHYLLLESSLILTLSSRLGIFFQDWMYNNDHYLVAWLSIWMALGSDGMGCTLQTAY